MNADARMQAMQYYEAAGRSIGADLDALVQHPQGVVLMMPQLVVLMKPVESNHPESWSELEQESPDADAWYVHLLVGNLALARRLAGALPPLRWLCFQRGQRSPLPHRIPWTAFCRITNSTPHSTHYGI